jgi:hypothetical protein
MDIISFVDSLKSDKEREVSDAAYEIDEKI